MELARECWSGIKDFYTDPRTSRLSKVASTCTGMAAVSTAVLLIVGTSLGIAARSTNIVSVQRAAIGVVIGSSTIMGLSGLTAFVCIKIEQNRARRRAQH